MTASSARKRGSTTPQSDESDDGTSLSRAHHAVAAMFFVNGAAYASWVARIPAVRDALVLRDKTLGIVLLGAAVGAIGAFRVAARLIARHGSRSVTRGAALAFCATLPLLSLAWNGPVLAATLALTGASSGLMDVAMNANAVDVEKRLGRPVLSALHGVFSLGGLVGAATGAAAAGAGVPVRWHLSSVAALLFVVALSTSRRLLVDDSPGASRPSSPSLGASFAVVGSPPAKRVVLLGLGTIAFCSSIGEGAMADWTAIYLSDVLASSAGVAALGFAAYSLAMLTGRFTGDRITSRVGERVVVRAAGCFVAIGLGVALATSIRPLFFVGVMATGLGLSVLVPVVFRAAGRLPGIAPGTALATIATLSYGGFLVGPPTIGLLAEHFTLRYGLLFVVALALVVIVLAPIVERLDERADKQADKTPRGPES